MFWSDGMQKLIIKMHERGEITRDEQDIYDSTVGWFLITKKLRNNNIIEEKGRNKENQKIWVLTDEAEDTGLVKGDDGKFYPPEEAEEKDIDGIHVTVVDALKIIRKYFGDE